MDTSIISIFKNLTKKQIMTGVAVVVEAEKESVLYLVEALGVIAVAEVEIKVILGQEVEVVQK